MTVALDAALFWTVFKWAGLVIVPLGAWGIIMTVAAIVAAPAAFMMSALLPGDRYEPRRYVHQGWAAAAIVFAAWSATLIVRGLIA